MTDTTDDDDDRDWREWAFLREKFWPDAIPYTGPKREYGPYPWGEKTHEDPHDVDDYPDSHPSAASVGDLYAGDVCPYCGTPTRIDQEVVTGEGERGELIAMTDRRDPEPAYHPNCWTQRQEAIGQLENRTLADFTSR